MLYVLDFALPGVKKRPAYFFRTARSSATPNLAAGSMPFWHMIEMADFTLQT